MGDDSSAIEAVFGVLEIKDTCSVRTCDGRAVAAFPVRTPAEGTGVWWLCDEHARRMPRGTGKKGSHAAGQAQEVMRTCRWGGEVPCGALATDVAVVGVRDGAGNPTLGIVSVCPRHARELASSDG